MQLNYKVYLVQEKYLDTVYMPVWHFARVIGQIVWWQLMKIVELEWKTQWSYNNNKALYAQIKNRSSFLVHSALLSSIPKFYTKGKLN